MKFSEFINEQNESFLSKTEQSKIQEYILDALKEFKISVRAIEFESRSIMVYYNFGEEAPKGYRTEREDIRNEIISEVKDIMKDVGYNDVMAANKLEAKNVGLVRFTIKK